MEALYATIQKGSTTMASIEAILPYEFDNTIRNNVKTLGVSGRVAIHNDFVSE
jgi:hypothetical protein